MAYGYNYYWGGGWLGYSNWWDSSLEEVTVTAQRIGQQLEELDEVLVQGTRVQENWADMPIIFYNFDNSLGDLGAPPEYMGAGGGGSSSSGTSTNNGTADLGCTSTSHGATPGNPLVRPTTPDMAYTTKYVNYSTPDTWAPTIEYSENDTTETIFTDAIGRVYNINDNNSNSPTFGQLHFNETYYLAPPGADAAKVEAAFRQHAEPEEDSADIGTAYNGRVVDLKDGYTSIFGENNLIIQTVSSDGNTIMNTAVPGNHIFDEGALVLHKFYDPVGSGGLGAGWYMNVISVGKNRITGPFNALVGPTVFGDLAEKIKADIANPNYTPTPIHADC